MAISNRNKLNGEPAYQVKVRDFDGRWYPARTFARKVDAQKYERQLLAQRDKGVQAATKDALSLTISEYWMKWSAECRNVHAGWVKSQDQMARDYILPVLGKVKLAQVRPQHIGSILDPLRDSLGPQTILHVYNLLHKMFEDSVGHYELLEKNPVLRRYRPKVSRKERNFLPPTDSWKLLNESRNHFLGPAIWVGILTGLRPSEIQALRWDAVDLEKKVILIKAAYKRKVRVIESFPKQGDWGMVPMPEPLVKYLEELRVITKSEFVAPGLGGKMLQYEVFLKGLKRLCRKVGVLEITPHELRHSSTELYIDQGASAEDIRRLLNHSSLTATQKYIHRCDGRLQSIAGKIGCAEVISISG